LPENKQLALEAYNQGVMCWSQGRPQDALRFYTEAIRLDDKMANAYGNRGVVRAALRDFKGALEDYSRAIKYDPKNHRSYYNRAQVREKIDDIAGAIQDYTTAHTLNPHDEEVICNRGIAYRLAGNYEKALVDLAAALRLDPNDWIAFYNLGSIKTNTGQFDGAIADLTRCIELNPQMDQAFHQRALAYSFAGRVMQSKADFEHILDMNPNYRFTEEIKAQLWRLKARQDDPLIGTAASVLMRFAYEQCGPRQKYAGFLGRPAEDSRWEVLVQPMYLISSKGYEREIAGATLDLLSRPHILVRVSPAQAAQYDVTFLVEAPIAKLPIPGFMELSTDRISATLDALYRQMQIYLQQKKLIKKKNRIVFGTMPLQAKNNQVWVFQMEQPVDE
jgi:tetratricopeptide (TPR) repeat protein